MPILKYKRVQTIILILSITVIAYASVTGPDARYTGAPGDIGNCVNCHDTFETENRGPGRVTIGGSPSFPTQYTPGEQYTLTVTVQQSGRSRFGFQLTVIDGSGNRAGTLQSLDSNTQRNAVTGTGGRQYIQHTQIGTTGAGGLRVWQFRWTAPATDVGTVTFYAAGNAANNDSTNQNDYIYTTRTLLESPTSLVELDFASDPSNQTLAMGAEYLIDWTATGLSNIASYELRYSTDDGATFPITNLITTITDPNITEFAWNVPETPTSLGRIRIQAATKAGSAVEIRSGRFSINETGEAEGPTIASAEFDGKKLFVNGSNFQQGAKVWMNGVEQKTTNEASDPTGLLKCKKAGKKVSSGQVVLIYVRNPDGTESAEFEVQKP